MRKRRFIKLRKTVCMVMAGALSIVVNPIVSKADYDPTDSKGRIWIANEDYDNGGEAVEPTGAPSGYYDNSAQTVYVTANGSDQTATVKLGDITEKYLTNSFVLNVGGFNFGAEANVTTGSIASDKEGNTGVRCAAASTGTANVTVNGDVNISGEGDKGVSVDTSTGPTYGGADSATANLHVTGDINSVNQGVSAESRGYQDSRTSVTVDGNVVSEDDTAVYVNAETGKTDVTVGGNAEGIDYGLDVWTSGNGKANVDVKGSVTGEEEGIDVLSVDKSSANVSVGGDVNSDEYNAIDIYAQNNSTVNAEIKGNVTSNEKYGASLCGGVNSDSEKNTITLSVDGDLRGELAGLCILPENSKIDVLVTGTIYAGEEGAIVASDLTDTDVVGSKTSVNITVYKVEAAADGGVGYEAMLNSGRNLLNANSSSESATILNANTTASLNANTAIENSINYIIKLEQPTTGGVLSALKSDGTALDTSFGYNVAKADQKVLLKVNLEDGYAVKAAYNGEGTKVALLKDSDGNYYVNVPKTGGVYLSVELEKAATTDTTITPDTTTTTPEVTVTPVTTDSPATSTTVTTTTSTNAASPKTGDSTNLMLVFGIMAMSVMGMVVISIKRRKDEE